MGVLAAAMAGASRLSALESRMQRRTGSSTTLAMIKLKVHQWSAAVTRTATWGVSAAAVSGPRVRPWCATP